MVCRSILAASALVALACAQTIETSSAASVAPSSTVAQSMPPSATAAFNPALVNSTMSFNWCLAQRNTCPQICGGAASVNKCDNVGLTYDCVCPNGTVPDVTAYIQTLPFFICQQTFIQCEAAHPDDAEGKATCATNEVCGTRNATAEALAHTSAAASSTAAATGSAAASGGSGSATASSSSSTASSSHGAAVKNQHAATGAFAAILMAAFKLLL